MSLSMVLAVAMTGSHVPLYRSGDCQLGADFMRQGDVEMFVLFNFVGMLHVTTKSAAPYDKPHDGRCVSVTETETETAT
jgi:hypothetical protein